MERGLPSQSIKRLLIRTHHMSLGNGLDESESGQMVLGDDEAASWGFSFGWRGVSFLSKRQSGKPA